MADINVNNLTFAYEGSYDNIFDNVSFSINTDWRLGFIGRNGKGKTTFLNLLLGKYPYIGTITSKAVFDYFPYHVSDTDLHKTADELMNSWKIGVETWRVMCELPALAIDAELLYRPFSTLSFGERNKIMLAVFFSGDNDFLLIDEPTNHLDIGAREIIKNYLKSKKGFILVSHDRDLLDACIDHVLVLNKESIEVQTGNFSSWWENKERADNYAKMENEKHLSEISKLKKASDRSRRWADKNEDTKIGYDPIKEHDRYMETRAYIGAKTKKMQARVKSYETRINREIEEKEGLLKDIESVCELQIVPKKYYKERLLSLRDFSLKYNDADKLAVSGITFEINQGDRLFIRGDNGCGKSSIIKAILQQAGHADSTSAINKNIADISSAFTTSGTLEVASNIIISYINQDTSHLKGNLRDYAKMYELDYTMLLTLLRKLDLERVQFEKNIETYSEGQKKKLLIASSLITSAHLYIWDEPFNYIDIFSRMQIEKLIKQYKPTMLIAQHDVRFTEEIATKKIQL